MCVRDQRSMYSWHLVIFPPFNNPCLPSTSSHKEYVCVQEGKGGESMDGNYTWLLWWMFFPSGSPSPLFARFMKSHHPDYDGITLPLRAAQTAARACHFTRTRSISAQGAIIALLFAKLSPARSPVDFRPNSSGSVQPAGNSLGEWEMFALKSFYRGDFMMESWPETHSYTFS